MSRSRGRHDQRLLQFVRIEHLVSLPNKNEEEVAMLVLDVAAFEGECDADLCLVSTSDVGRSYLDV